MSKIFHTGLWLLMAVNILYAGYRPAQDAGFTLPLSTYSGNFVYTAGKAPVSETFIHVSGIFHITAQTSQNSDIRTAAAGAEMYAFLYKTVNPVYTIQGFRYTWLNSLTEIIFPFHDFW